MIAGLPSDTWCAWSQTALADCKNTVVRPEFSGIIQSWQQTVKIWIPGTHQEMSRSTIISAIIAPAVSSILLIWKVEKLVSESLGQDKYVFLLMFENMYTCHFSPVVVFNFIKIDVCFEVPNQFQSTAPRQPQ